jgi:hypothetical protein
MDLRTTRILAAAAALALTLGACMDAPTSPAAARIASAGQPARSLSELGPTLVSSAVKYRDSGGKAARGRSGVAEASALAVLDRSGTTTLSFSARHATYPWMDGSVDRAQIKALSAQGRHKFTRNVMRFEDNGTTGRILKLQGLGRGDQLQVQAHVGELDPNRVDVVTVTEPVKRMPDLQVKLSAPAEAQTNTWVTIMAVISERNGDMGAYTGCELYVAGVRVDYGDAVWVDAGDTVTCLMAWNFTAPGAYPIEVRTPVPPEGDLTTATGEWDPTDNAATGTIQVHGERAGFQMMAEFYHTTEVDSSVAEDQWRNTFSGEGGEGRQVTVNASSNQWARAYGWMPLHVTEPADLRVSMSTGGRVVHSAEWTQLGAGTPWGWCADVWDGTTMFYLCTGGGGVLGSTDFSYLRMAGSVSYHSQGYSRVWDEFTGPEGSVYHWNDAYGWDGTVPPGDDWTFDVRLSTASDEYVASKTLQLVRSSQVFGYPYQCSTYGDPEWGYSGTACSSWTYRIDSVSGL